MSDSGTLHKWDIQALTMRNYTIDIKLSPLTLAACPHKKNLIAIGCKNGNIIVYDLSGMKNKFPSYLFQDFFILQFYFR